MKKIRNLEFEQESISSKLQKKSQELEESLSLASASLNEPNSLDNYESSEPPRQVYCKNPETVPEFPVFMFVIGGEGTGHHLLAGVLDEAPGVQRLSLKIQQLFVELWEPTIEEGRRETKKQELINELQKIRDDYDSGKGFFFHFFFFFFLLFFLKKNKFFFFFFFF